MSLMLQQNPIEICVKKMIFLITFFTITFLKGQQLGMYAFLESVSLCIDVTEEVVWVWIGKITKNVGRRETLSLKNWWRWDAKDKENEWSQYENLVFSFFFAILVDFGS